MRFLGILIACCLCCFSCGLRRTAVSGPEPVVKLPPMSELDLDQLLEHYGFVEKPKNHSESRYFTLKVKPEMLGTPEWAWRRNELQAQIMAVSEQLCGAYKKKIRDEKSSINFWLGTFTSMLAGAGSVFTSESTSRALSAAAGVASGTRAEFDQAFFSNLAIHVIISGMDTKRLDLKKNILAKKGKDLKEYPVHEAIGDAVEFHSACNIVTGLILASDAIQLKENPGIEQLKKFQEMSPYFSQQSFSNTLANAHELSNISSSVTVLSLSDNKNELTVWIGKLTEFAQVNSSTDPNCGQQKIGEIQGKVSKLIEESDAWTNAKVAVSQNITGVSKEYSDLIQQFASPDQGSLSLSNLKKQLSELLIVARYSSESLRKEHDEHLAKIAEVKNTIKACPTLARLLLTDN